MKSKLFRLVSVLLVIAMLSVSFICDAFAVTERGEPEGYMIGFDSNLWQITDDSDNVSITAGGARCYLNQQLQLIFCRIV